MNSTTRKITGIAAFIALGLILPMLVHGVNLGVQIAPIHIPVLICGLVLGGAPGLVCGALLPLISSLLTSMPPLYPVATTMMFECALYGGIAGFLFNRVKMTKCTVCNMLVSLVVAMLVGRIGYAILNALLTAPSALFTKAPVAFYTSLIVKGGWMTMILHLIVVPIIALALLNAIANMQKANSREQ